MKVNKKIREVLDEIATASVEYANNPDENRKYVKRLLTHFDNKLTQDERVFLVNKIFYNMLINSRINDPEFHRNVYKLKQVTLISYGVIVSLITVIITDLFGGGSITGNVLEFVKFIAKNIIS